MQQLTVDIPYEQLIDIIRHLPPKQLARIRADFELLLPVKDVETKKNGISRVSVKRSGNVR